MKVQRRFIETVTIEPQIPPEVVQRALVEDTGTYPDTLYPEIRAITANKVTRNKTFYPLEYLEGSPAEGNGIASWLYPYPKPVIRDHATGAFSGSSSEVYGRVKYARIINDGSAYYVSVIPEITDKGAIKKILTGQFLTVSVGVEAERVECSICGVDLLEDECEHIKGKMYTIDGKKQKMCYWKIGPLQFDELSFVVVPSDNEARIITPNVNTSKESVRIFGWTRANFGETILEERLAEYASIQKETTRLIHEAEEADEICTLGDLYGLDNDDPDYTTTYLADETAQEKALTTKQRKALPASAFCGPNRTFPAHDLVHAVQGLRMLGRYKGPGNKARIRACLLRKAAAFRKKENKLFAAGYLVDDKYMVEYPLFPISDAENTAKDILASEFTKDQKNSLLKAVAAYCDNHNIERPNQLKELDPGDPLRIALNHSTYPLLYTVIEAMETYILEALMSDDLKTTEGAPEQIPDVVNDNTSAETSTADTAIVDETAPDTKEAAPAPDAISEAPKSSEVAPANEPCPDCAVLTQQIEQLQKELAALQAAQTAMQQAAAAKEAAILLKAMGRPKAEGKSVAELSTSLLERSLESLTDTVNDLIEDLENRRAVETRKSVVDVLKSIDPTTVEKVVTPVALQDEKVEVEGCTISPITEEEVDVVEFVTGINMKSYQTKVDTQLRMLTGGIDNPQALSG